MADEDLIVRAALRDELSAGLRGIRTELSRTTAAADALSAGSVASGKGLGELSAASKDSSAALSDLNSDLVSASNTAGNLFVGALKTGATALGVLGTVVAGFGLKSASQFQQSKLAFDTLLGSVSQGNALFSQLQKISITTPFQLTDIAPATQLLLRYGVAANQVIPILKSLLDAAALSGDPKGNLQALTLATGQIITAGQINGRNALELTRAGIPIYQAMAAQLGITTAAAKKLGDTGKLSSAQYIQALTSYAGPLAKLQGGAGKLATTLGGQLTNLWDAIKIRLADSATGLVDQITKLIKPITAVVGDAIDKFGPPLFSLIGILVQGLQRGLPIIAPLLALIVKGFGDLLTAAGPALSALDPLSGQIGDSLVKLFAALVPVMPDVVKLLIAMVGVLPTFLDTLTQLIPLTVPLLKLITALLGFSPVKSLMADLLLTLLGYKYLSGAVQGLITFAKAIGAVGTEAELTGSKALVAKGNLLSLAAAAGIVGALGISQGLPGVTSGHGSASDYAEVIGGSALVGGAIGSVVPGVGTVIGAGAGALVGGAYSILGAAFGDPVVPGPTMNRHLMAGGGAAGLRITSGLRNFGVRGPSSGHVKGTAVDVAGSGLDRYVHNVRKQGGFATIEGHGDSMHAHAQWGDPSIGSMPSTGGTAGGGGGDSFHFFEGAQVNGQVDLETGLYNALAKVDRMRAERGWNPVRGR